MTFEEYDAYRKPEHLGATGRARPAVACFSGAWGALAAGACWLFKRRDEVRASKAP